MGSRKAGSAVMQNLTCVDCFDRWTFKQLFDKGLVYRGFKVFLYILGFPLVSAQNVKLIIKYIFWYCYCSV